MSTLDEVLAGFSEKTAMRDGRRTLMNRGVISPDKENRGGSENLSDEK
jgi:hypothetical protein